MKDLVINNLIKKEVNSFWNYILICIKLNMLN